MSVVVDPREEHRRSRRTVLTLITAGLADRRADVLGVVGVADQADDRLPVSAEPLCQRQRDLPVVSGDGDHRLSLPMDPRRLRSTAFDSYARDEMSGELSRRLAGLAPAVLIAVFATAGCGGSSQTVPKTLTASGAPASQSTVTTSTPGRSARPDCGGGSPRKAAEAPQLSAFLDRMDNGQKLTDHQSWHSSKDYLNGQK